MLPYAVGFAIGVLLAVVGVLFGFTLGYYWISRKRGFL